MGALEDYRIGRNKSNGKNIIDHRANVENMDDVVFEKYRKCGAVINYRCYK